MNLQDFRYFAAVAEHRHFGRAAAACFVSQPTLSSQIRKLEEELGVTLLERTNKRVELTPIGRDVLEHVQRILAETAQVEQIARTARDPMIGALRLGVIPTLAPYLMPLILAPLRQSFPELKLELWEDQTHALLEALRAHQLDGALIASPVAGGDLVELPLFEEPLLAALPLQHELARQAQVEERELAEDLLVMADGHCLSNQALSACAAGAGTQATMRAATLETLVNLVAAGYGTTLVPALSASSLERYEIKIAPLQQRSTRLIRLVSRRAYPRGQALLEVAKMVRRKVPRSWRVASARE